MAYISRALRQLVTARAQGRCEYCQTTQAIVIEMEIDHIVPEAAGGITEAANLCFACISCNRNKGSDLGSIYWPSGQLVRFFHPRTEHWADHFALHSALIDPLTAIAEVTTRILDFNSAERLQERHGLIEAGRYPPPTATVRMRRRV